jgi:hypothetical protein
MVPGIEDILSDDIRGEKMRISTLLSILLITLLAALPASAADSPKVDIVVPSDGEFISGTIPVTVDVNPAEGVERVDLFIDGKPLASMDKAPWIHEWNMNDWSVGPHDLRAVAVYGGGTAEDSVTIRTGPQMKLVDLGDGEYGTGDTLVVAVQVNRVTGINGVNFRLAFEPEKLEFVSCDQRYGFEGENFLGSPLFLGTLAEPGLVACNATIKKGDPIKDGSGNVAYVSFEVKSDGPIKMSLINSAKYVRCIDQNGDPLNVDVKRDLVLND